jgi:uncharacterized protein (DUF2236 family)
MSRTPAPGTSVDEPMFPRGSIIRRVNEEPAIGFGAGRALLLQIAHPHVAAGVDEHSDFQSNPFKRLLGTLEAVYTTVYGTKADAAGVGRRIRWIHDFVTGPAYAANDPANLLWVHATLADSALASYERVVGPLTPAELERYYEEMAVVAEAFGCPRSEQPATFEEFRAYWDEQVRTMEVTDTARKLAADILEPKLPFKLHVPLWPTAAVFRLVTVGTLPEPIRERFGYSWTDAQQRRLDRLFGLARASTKVTPRALRVGPVRVQGRLLLRLARKHVAEFDAKQAARTGAEVAAA